MAAPGGSCQAAPLDEQRVYDCRILGPCIAAARALLALPVTKWRIEIEVKACGSGACGWGARTCAAPRASRRARRRRASSAANTSFTSIRGAASGKARMRAAKRCAHSG